jgi:aminoglycoside phosphotransferase (APT) family kinase protein
MHSMRGLRERDRDRHLPARMGEPSLVPPSAEELLGMVCDLLIPSEATKPVVAHWTHARWKHGVAAAATYCLHWPDGFQSWVTWKKHLSGKGGKHARSIVEVEWRATSEHRLLPGAILSDGAYLVSFPRDRVLPGLERALDDKRTIRWIKELDLFDSSEVRRRRSTFTALRYKPERRAVLVVDLSLKHPDGTRGERRVGVRVHEPEETMRIEAVRAALKLDQGLRYPALLGSDPTAGILLEEWVTGTAPAEGSFEHVELVGEALAHLHNMLPPAGEMPEKIPALGSLRTLDADLAAEAERLMRAIPLPRGRVLIHGDMHSDQWLLDDEGIVMLDLDDLRPGEPEEDLASWLADVHLEGAAADEQRERLLAAYAKAGGPGINSFRLDQLILRQIVIHASSALRRMDLNAEEQARKLMEAALRLENRCRLTPTESLQVPLPNGVRAEWIVRGAVQKTGRLVLECKSSATAIFHARSTDGIWTQLTPSDDDRLPGLCEQGAARLSSWRPGRRAAWRDKETGHAIKALRPSKLAKIVDRATRVQVLRGMGAPLVPAPFISMDTDLGLMSHGWVEGIAPSLGQTAVWKQVGEGLAVLQESVPIDGLPEHEVISELAVIEALGMRQVLAGLQLPIGVETVHADLTDRMPQPGPQVAVHRDLHDDQLIVGLDGTVALIDWDLLAKGDREVDLANLGVHLILRAWQGRGSHRDAWEARKAVLDGYASKGGQLSLDTLDFYERATALRLVMIYRLRPRWVYLVPGLMDLAKGGVRVEACRA